MPSAPGMDPNSSMTRQNTGTTATRLQSILDALLAMGTLIQNQQTLLSAHSDLLAAIANSTIEPVTVHVDNPSSLSIPNPLPVQVQNPTPGPLATQPISGNVGVTSLPAGLATSALQTTGNDKLELIRLLLAGTLGISAANLPLPNGASTSTLQTDTIAKLEAMRVLLAAASTSALQTSGNTTLTSILSALVAGIKVSTTGDSYYPITGNTPAGGTVVKSGAGTFQRVVVSSDITLASSLTIYDNTTNSGTILYRTTNLLGIGSGASPSVEFNLKTATGLTVVTSGISSGRVIVVYS